LDVTWTTDAPSQSNKVMRVPMPARGLPREQAIEARGFADSFALRQRCHDTARHARSAPTEPAARPCHDAIETVRYEAIGARDYAGIRGSLNAAEVMRLASDPIARANTVEDVPLPVALSLLLRERLTGAAVP